MTADLYYEVHDGSGPPMLLVHGLLSSRAQWRPNLEALAGFSRPVVVELLGHGRSPAPADAAMYRPDAYVAAFERVREALRVDRWHVCGQSLGAALTLRYALAHPERLLAHVFTNSNSALAPDSWARSARPGMEALAEALAREGLAAIERLPIHPKRARKLPAEVKAELIADCALHSPIGIANSGRHTVIGSSVRDRAASNRVPTLLVHGVRERRFAEHARFAVERIPHLERADLDAGHAVNLEAPVAFDGVVREFIRGTTG